MMHQREAVFNFPGENSYQYRRSSLRESNCVEAVADSISGYFAHRAAAVRTAKMATRKPFLELWLIEAWSTASVLFWREPLPGIISNNRISAPTSNIFDCAALAGFLLGIVSSPYLYRQADPCFLKWSHQFF
jgi:hypothetical protein